jgi:GNAT superfamily N-acetyltransferase
MDRSIYWGAGQSVLAILRSELGQSAWTDLARLLDSGCTKPGWILLGFEAGRLMNVLILAAPSEFNLPLEIIQLHRVRDRKTDCWQLFPRAIEKARELGVSELYCTVPEKSPEAAALSEAGFRRWRKIVRFESAGPVDLGVRGYRSVEAGNFPRSEVIALIEKTSEHSLDSQIEFYRKHLGTVEDAEMTLRMMESTKYQAAWWRLALAPGGEILGVIFPVLAFGEPTIGFLGIVPEYRGRKIASFLLAEAWSIMKEDGHSSLCAEVDQRSVSMQRALAKSQFTRRSPMQEWRLEL